MQRIARWNLMAAGWCVALRRRSAPPGAGLSRKAPVRIVVPYPAGGYTDILAGSSRRDCRRSSASRSSSTTSPGPRQRSRRSSWRASPPDGHTLLMTTVTTLALNPLTMKDLRYRADQFVPVALVARQPFMLVASLHVSAEQSEGAHRVRESKSGQGQLGDARARRVVAAGRRAPEVAGRHRHDGDPLQRQRARQHRHHGRARGRALRRRRHVAAERRRQEGQGDRRDVGKAHGDRRPTFPPSSNTACRRWSRIRGTASSHRRARRRRSSTSSTGRSSPGRTRRACRSRWRGTARKPTR